MLAWQERSTRERERDIMLPVLFLLFLLLSSASVAAAVVCGSLLAVYV